MRQRLISLVEVALGAGKESSRPLYVSTPLQDFGATALISLLQFFPILAFFTFLPFLLLLAIFDLDYSFRVFPRIGVTKNEAVNTTSNSRNGDKIMVG